MVKQKYFDCYTTGDDTKRKAYTKDGKQRVTVTRTITRDCATGIVEEAERDDDEIVCTLEDMSDDDEIVLTRGQLSELIRQILLRHISRSEGMSDSR